MRDAAGSTTQTREFDTHSLDFVRAAVRAVMGSQQVGIYDREDIVQEVALRIFVAHGEDALRSWNLLREVARNLVIDLGRRHANRPTSPLRDVAYELRDAVEDRDQIAAFKGGLTEEQRGTLDQYEANGFRVKDTAAALGECASTIAQRIHHIRTKAAKWTKVRFS